MGKKKNGNLLNTYMSPYNKKHILEYSHLTLEERKVITVTEVVQCLIKAHEEKRDVNLNALKHKIASKYGMPNSPKLVDIIAAVPTEYKKILVPKLMAKPIRTASGVSTSNIYENNRVFYLLFININIMMTLILWYFY